MRVSVGESQCGVWWGRYLKKVLCVYVKKRDKKF